MLLRHRQDFRHLTAAPPNDQRAFLEAAILTTTVLGDRDNEMTATLGRTVAKVGWKFDLDTEMSRIASAVSCSVIRSLTRSIYENIRSES